MIGEYRIVEFLGAGGMGEVYLAEHNKIGRRAAVKVLTQAVAAEGLLDRFFNEARIQASLHHPNIATLYDFIEVNGQPGIIMEYVDGQTLAERVRPKGPLPLGETVYIFQAVVEAVAYIHNYGIVHRDIKSNNIKISTDGQVKLLDFGIAKADASPTLTATGSVIGTLEYISPEQLMGGTADARSDIWALGVLLYEMITGRVPFEALTLGELCKKIERVDYAPPTVLNPAVPRAVTSIISRCLRKNPMDRYRLAQDLLEDTKRLRALVSTPGLTNVGGASIGRRQFSFPSLPNVNWKILTAVAGGAMLLLVLVVGSYIAFSAPNQTAAETAPPQTAAPTETTAQRQADDTQATNVTIDTNGGSADVYRDGVKVDVTPYHMTGVPIGSTIRLVLKRDGFEDYPIELTVTAQTGTRTFNMIRQAADSSDAGNN
jgi:serine/threonine-protein kinase